MARWLPLVTLLLASCGHSPTPQECKSLAQPKAVIKRCFGGDLTRNTYLGDLRCWPFSASHQMRGVWLIGLETSVFYPGASRAEQLRGNSEIWLQTDLFERRPDLVAAAQGAGAVAYVVDFDGRSSLCDGTFGHFGVSRRQVIVDKFHSMTPLALPKG